MTPILLPDRKNHLAFLFWSFVNSLACKIHFRKYELCGAEKLPASGGYILVANHYSRWDGLVLYNMMGRPANFMVHPNELQGLQGQVLASMGAFPSSARYDLLGHAKKCFAAGEPLVVFPEGGIFRDGTIRNFKNGVAKIALRCGQNGMVVPIFPVSLHYGGVNGKEVTVVVGDAVVLEEYLTDRQADVGKMAVALSHRLRREVCYLLSETEFFVNDYNGTSLCSTAAFGRVHESSR